MKRKAPNAGQLAEKAAYDLKTLIERMNADVLDDLKQASAVPWDVDDPRHAELVARLEKLVEQRFVLYETGLERLGLIIAAQRAVFAEQRKTFKALMETRNATAQRAPGDANSSSDVPG